MDQTQVIEDVADILVEIETSEVPFKQFQADVGPYGEPQLLRGIAELERSAHRRNVRTKRCPDLALRIQAP